MFINTPHDQCDTSWVVLSVKTVKIVLNTFCSDSDSAKRNKIKKNIIKNQRTDRFLKESNNESYYPKLTLESLQLREELNKTSSTLEKSNKNVLEDNKTKQMTKDTEELKDEKQIKAGNDENKKRETAKKGGKNSVRELMSIYLLTASPDTILKEANRLMNTKQTHHILITDENNSLLGILSDRDIKKFVSPFANSNIADSKDRATLNLKLGQIMTRNPVTITPEKSVSDCIELMLEKSINALPVIDDKKRVIGIITTTNIFKYILTILK